MPTSTEEGRITVELLKAEFKHLREDMVSMCEEVRGWRQEDRASVVALRSEVLQWRKEDYAERQRLADEVHNLDGRVTRNEERIKSTTGGLAVLNVIVGTIAAALGRVGQ